ncbi:15218_t:CDS:2, partial [Gigaspora rosea]
MEPIRELYNIYKQDAQEIINSQQAFKEYTLDKLYDWISYKKSRKQQTTSIEDSFYYSSEESPDTINLANRKARNSTSIGLASSNQNEYEVRIQKQEDVRVEIQEDGGLKSCNTKYKMEDTEVIKFDGGKNKTEGDRNSSGMATMSVDMEAIGIKEDTVPDTKKAGAGIKGKMEVQTQPSVAQKDSTYTHNTNMVAEIAKIGKDIEKAIKEESRQKDSKKKCTKIIIGDFNSIRSNELNRKGKGKAIPDQNNIMNFLSQNGYQD